ncbi:hypothetical protein BJ508DRAFT_334982 [Ascobolus immersus RN42]|uniref:Uncharacterized protein n=1 Tax=Ascobolus immersus RN42 TaxID=1160509 RepID=A0A3N4HHG8_ASCIM|nr:hypothetical protein BJ508DRAFT_334982 [Ascobolus immersus RN42]
MEATGQVEVAERTRALKSFDPLALRDFVLRNRMFLNGLYNDQILNRNATKECTVNGRTTRWAYPCDCKTGQFPRTNVGDFRLVPRGYKALKRCGADDFRPIFRFYRWNFREFWSVGRMRKEFCKRMRIRRPRADFM